MAYCKVTIRTTTAIRDRMKEAAERRQVTANHAWQIAAFEYLRPPAPPPKGGLIERFFHWLFAPLRP